MRKQKPSLLRRYDVGSGVMRYKITVRPVFFLIISFFASHVLAIDWSYEPGEKEKEIYSNKIVQIPCSKIGDLLKENNTSDIYTAIRDAALFKDKDCRKYIEANLSKLDKEGFLKDVISFYEYKLGDKSKIKSLVTSFDKDARKAGDHHTVELFGFLEDWKYSGKRLVIHSGYSDGAGSEILCSAIMWRRILFGNEVIETKWNEIVKQKKINDKKSLYLLDRCK
jgi:hypothetical protein